MTDEKTNNPADGQTLGRYRILQKLGAGGMGEVFLAEDAELERKVALKILPAEVSMDAERIRRFVREAKAASALNHPNILTIYEIGQATNSRFIATEFIEGETLRGRLNNGSFALGETLDIAVQIASALQAAHAAGIVHRDIKPENIMLRDADNLVKILDFGIAKLSEKKPESIDAEAATAIKAESTNPGVVIGTANYMSPEQARGRAVDSRSDIFSFGIVLYEMLSGKRAFACETAMDTIGAILHKEPVPLNQILPEIPQEIESVVNKMLKKDAGERYKSAKDLLVDLKNLQRRLDFEAELNRERETGRKGEEENMTKIQSSPLLPVSSSPHLNSIAVLPFTNMSADAENEYFCDGLAEELLNALAKIEDLRVAARTSAFSFKGKNAEASQIGKTLNVKTVLEGSVRKSDNRLRITVQLINATDGYHLWSERYDREMRDIFDVQDEITLAVVDALKLKLFGDEKAAVLKRYTDNTEAYELYLKGLYHFNKWTTDGLRRSLEYFEQATGKEPEFAPAYAKIADYYGFLSHVGLLSPREIFPKWQMAAERALEIDDRLADAHLAMAHIHFYYERNWAQAENEFERAVELNPNDSYARRNYGLFLVSTGKFDRAFNECKKALELDPLSPSLNLVVGFIYLFAGRLDDAREQLLRLNELEPNSHGAYWFDAELLLANGKYEESIAMFQKTLALSENQFQLALSKLGYVYGLAGKRDEALKVLGQLLDLRERQYAAAFNVARVYAGLGETDKTFEWLEKALEERNGELAHTSPFIKAGSGIYWGENFLADPRYQNILRRIGLPTNETAQRKMTNEASESATQIFDSAETRRGNVSKSPVPATGESNAQNNDTQVTNKATADTPQHSTSSAEYIAREVKKHKRGFAATVLALLLAGTFAGFGWWFYANRAAGTKQIESIAVLPFENASGNADLDYLSDGVSESVIDRLSQLSQLKVIARSSSFRYRGQDLNIKEIADALGVEAIVTGRVVPRGDSYQIRVELVDVRENKQLWGENFTRKVSDVQILQTDISREIADNLRLRLSGAQTQQLASQGTTNPQAYELLLKGRFYFNKSGRENLDRAVEYFEQAVILDPNFALAYADLSEGYHFGGGRGLDQKNRVIKQDAAARKALELDPNLGEAHHALASINRDRWEWQDAEREYRRAIELNPNIPRAHGGYSIYLSLMKQHDEAITEAKRARELDPLSFITDSTVSVALFRARRYDEAIEAVRRGLELHESLPLPYRILGDIYAAKEMYPEAIGEYQKAIRLSGGDSPQTEVRLGAVYVKAGMRAKAEEILQKLKAKENEPLPSVLAILYAALGMRDEAFIELEKAFTKRSLNLPFIAVEPAYDNLRSDPRFQDLLRRMNLPQ